MAWSNQLEQSVLLRVFKGEGVDDAAFARFQSEAQMVSKLHHPNINPLLEIGACSGRPYATEEFVDGHTLAEELEHNGQGLPLDQVLVLARALTAALGCAHEKGLLHRNVTPENVLLVEGRTWRLAHFAFMTSTAPALTGTSFGNLPYAAPEVISGETIDAKADIFSLGATLYEALCGRRPFEDKDRDTPVIPLRKHRESMPQALAEAVHRCLSLEKGGRPTVHELATQLGAVEKRFDKTWSQATPVACISALSPPWPSGALGHDPMHDSGEVPAAGAYFPIGESDPTREFVEATREYQEATREYQNALCEALKDQMDDEELARFVKALKHI